MAFNPICVLKRKLDDETIPLSKRLRLAENVVHTYNFPLIPKERIIAKWLGSVLMENNRSGKEFKNVLSWMTSIDHVGDELKSQLIQITCKYLQSCKMTNEDIPTVINFIDNEKLIDQLNLHIEEYCLIFKNVLKYIKNNQTESNVEQVKKLLNNLVNFYKKSKRKLDLIIKILDGDNIEIIFEYIDVDECKNDALLVCQTLLFPMNKKSFYIQFLRTIMQKESIDELLEERGDSIKSVLKVMSAFFTFPNGRILKDQNFLQKFIEAFVFSFKSDSQLIFSFYIMVVSSLNIQQAYIAPSMKMPIINFNKNDEKVKRSMFLQMLKFLLEYEIDITVKLTDILNTKVHVKKNFSSFLQYVLMGQLKLEGKLDKISLDILKIALKLDPTLIEQKIDKILPPLMITKKNNQQPTNSYTEMLNSFLEILFKLSKGNSFITKILPHIKVLLESGNTEQFELHQNIAECFANGMDCENLQAKMITGLDLFPRDCIECYGKLTSTLMFRQNCELFLSLQKDFEEHCLMMLEDGFVSPSIITLTEVLSAILSTFLSRTKMADHTVPKQTADEFWSLFNNFENDVLKRFGCSLLKLSYNNRLTQSFLKLCQGYTQLKLLHIKQTGMVMNVNETNDVLDFNFILPCLTNEQWVDLTSRISDNETKMDLENLLLIKTTAAELFGINNDEIKTVNIITDTKTHVIKDLSKNNEVLSRNSLFHKVLFSNLSSQQLKLISKSIIKELIADSNCDILNIHLLNNVTLLNALTLETLKYLLKSLESSTENVYPLLSKALTKSEFSITSFLTEVKNVPEYFEHISSKKDLDIDSIRYIEILKRLQIYYLDENIQLTTILVLLALKRSIDSKKVHKNIDHLLLTIFEISPKYPDLYKIFPLDYIFEFEIRTFIDLLTVKLKSINPLFLIKCLLECAVKKVKTDSGIVKVLVKMILKNRKHKTSLDIDYFCNKAFQITCLLLPVIAKEKKAITTSAYRSILAELQENLHKTLLKSLKIINFKIEKDSLDPNNTEVDSLSECNMATLNAMEAFSLTLSKYCESSNAEDIQNLDCIWTGLEYLVQKAIQNIHSGNTKTHHTEQCLQLINTVLRYSKKLENHAIFKNKDEILKKIWLSVKARLLKSCEDDSVQDGMEEITVTMKFVTELMSTEAFIVNVVSDLYNLTILDNENKKSKKQNTAEHSRLTAYQASKYLWTCCLKANLLDKKNVAMSKSFHHTCKNMNVWIWQHYQMLPTEVSDCNQTVVKVDDTVCQMLNEVLDVLIEFIACAKKIVLNYKFLDAIFESMHTILFVMGSKTGRVRCDISCHSYFTLYKTVLKVMNTLLQHREEILEDRWPCYLQCYRSLIKSICEKYTSDVEIDKDSEDKLADISHCVEKLTQSISKRKSQISRLAAYTVGDLCSIIETSGPPKILRQHLENSISLLLQASDSTYAMSFLRRALAGSSGQITMTNMYTNYKRYHKYVGNA